MNFDRDFGVNQVFVEDLYQAWLQNPASVEEGWNLYFSALSGVPANRGYWTQAPTPAAPFGQPEDLRGFSVAPPVQAPQPVAMQQQGLQLPARPEAAERKVDDRAAASFHGVASLINTYRLRGHLWAQIDPLGFRKSPGDELAPRNFGLEDRDLDEVFQYAGVPGLANPTLRRIVDRLQQTYCRTIGCEYVNHENVAGRDFLQKRMEETANVVHLSRAEKLRVLQRLTDGETLEQFLHKRFNAAKRFSAEGGETLIPMLDWLIDESGDRGVQEVVIGMAHRGRLNVLANVLGKRTSDIFAEFEDRDATELVGRGDVKYHLGFSSERTTRSGKKVHVNLAFNPSHLEIVNPVVAGRVRAKQDRAGRDPDRKKVMPVLIHGDAAFMGQGVVAETLNLQSLDGYTVGGTIHIVINNQVGFTTNPSDSRSTTYCTDIARMLRAPVFHVNGDDPEAAIWTVMLAVEYRQKFGKDVVIDLVCYRKYGHNEGDEPAFTQPLMYEVIKKKLPPRAIYAKQLVSEGVITEAEAEQIVAQDQERLESELERMRSTGAKRTFSPMTDLWGHYKGGPDLAVPEVPTSLSLEKLRELALKSNQLPANFTAHEKVAAVLAARRKLAEPGQEHTPFDWGTGEALALASLLDEGTSIRFSGQDVRRGTFTHRHAGLIDVKTGARLIPAQQVAKSAKTRFELYDSPLSEAGVLGFDYGFSLDAPDWLVCWEAQFGDFVNGAQVLIDQFISSAEDKWGRLSGLTMLLPHGFEGQGPEHSSGRLERFLQLCAEDNIQVCNLSTPANFFHALRRQMVRSWRKPLVVMTPKSLLRHKGAVSTLSELAEGHFQKVIGDTAIDAQKARKVLLCSGKVYFDLLAAREARKIDNVAIIRVEQLYPLPEAELQHQLALYRESTPIVWVQEEPFNMGAWYFLRARWPASLRKLNDCVARPESASPATGSHSSHKYEQTLLCDQALA
jgi:2-oxoglutarate dehydrogenase E1 component